MSLYSQLCEYTFNNVLNKQRSITSLFPTFNKRVTKVKSSGGVHLVNQFPELWDFKAASASGKGTYDIYLRFKNIPEMIKKFAGNVKLWNKDKTNVDYNELGPEILNKVDLEIDCSCPADLYWGPEYIKTQKKAQFGHQEDRPPKIRNPKQYGILCKHQQALFDKLPSYNFTFNGFLKLFWDKEIQVIVEDTKKRLGLVKQVTKELGKKAEVEKEKPVSYGRGGKVVEVPSEEVETEEKQKEEE